MKIINGVAVPECEGVLVRVHGMVYTFLGAWDEDGSTCVRLRGYYDGVERVNYVFRSTSVLPAISYVPAEDFTIQEVQCERCGKHTIGYLTDTVDGGVCKDCLETRYGKCSCCGKWYCLGSMILVEGYKCVCENCADAHYVQCQDCGDWVHVDNAQNDGSVHYCRSCFDDNYYYCDSCGCIAHNDDAYDYNGRTLCRSCYEEQSDDDDLHCHGSKQPVQFHGRRSRSGIPINGAMYYGMELEMECPDRRGNVVSRIQEADENNYYLEEDSSLRNGIEVISHARTFESWNGYWDEYETKVLFPARQEGCTAHDAGTCGIHIHTSLEAWDGPQLFRVFSLLYNRKNFEAILTITQRKRDNLEHWASLEVRDIGKFKKSIESKTRPFESRYAGLNITDKTLEFRIFNSSLRLERVQKNMEFVFALFVYTKKAKRVSWARFMAWVARHKEMVPHLYEFLIERGLTRALYKESASVVA